MPNPGGRASLAGVSEAVRIAPIDAADDELAVGVLARSFRDNPLDIAVIGGSSAWRLASVTWGMRSSLRAARSAEGVALLGAWREGEEPRGVLLAIPSSSLPLPPPPLLGHLRSTLGQGLRASRRWGVVFQALEPHQPREPHWYLSLLGVDEPARRSGVGSQLLRSWLDAVDRDRLPAYLETDRQENLGFYAREGFAVASQLEVLGAPIWCMRRPSV